MKIHSLLVFTLVQAVINDIGNQTTPAIPKNERASNIPATNTNNSSGGENNNGSNQSRPAARQSPESQRPDSQNAEKPKSSNAQATRSETSPSARPANEPNSTGTPNNQNSQNQGSAGNQGQGKSESSPSSSAISRPTNANSNNNESSSRNGSGQQSTVNTQTNAEDNNSTQERPSATESSITTTQEPRPSNETESTESTDTPVVTSRVDLENGTKTEGTVPEATRTQGNSNQGNTVRVSVATAVTAQTPLPSQTISRPQNNTPANRPQEQESRVSVEVVRTREAEVIPPRQSTRREQASVPPVVSAPQPTTAAPRVSPTTVQQQRAPPVTAQEPRQTPRASPPPPPPVPTQQETIIASVPTIAPRPPAIPNQGGGIRPVIQNRPNSPKGISAFLQADEQQIQARVIENQANPAAVVPPVSAPESNSSNATVLTLPVILSITGGVFVLAIAGFLVVRRSSKKPEPGLPPPVAFSEPSTPSIPRLAEHDNIFAMPKPAPYEPMFSKPQMDSFVSLPPLDRRTSIYSNQSIGNEKTGLLHRYSDIFTDDVMSDQSNSLNRLPKQDVSHNLANIALRVATDDSSKHTSIFSDSNYSTSTYSQRDSQFTTGTFEFSEVSDYDVFLKAQSMEGSQLADAALQMIRRNREQQRDSQDSLF